MFPRRATGGDASAAPERNGVQGKAPRPKGGATLFQPGVSQMTYSPGGTKAICDRCGFEYPLKSLRKEWTGLMVCSADFDQRPAQMMAPNVKAEGVALPNARPDNQGGNEPNTTAPGDL